jgi:hypothetical protein
MSAFLWTQGSVVGVNPKAPQQPVFKDAALKPLPHLILLRRFSGDGGWHDTCQSVMSLSRNTLGAIFVNGVFLKNFLAAADQHGCHGNAWYRQLDRGRSAL